MIQHITWLQMILAFGVSVGVGIVSFLGFVAYGMDPQGRSRTPELVSAVLLVAAVVGFLSSLGLVIVKALS